MKWFGRLRLRPAVAITTVSVLVVVSVLALSALFAQSDQTVRVAQHGKVLQATEGLLNATTAERGASAVALLVAEAAASGTASDEQLAVAATDLMDAASEVRARCTRLASITDDTGGGIEVLAESAAAAGELVSGHLTQGDLSGAMSTANETLLPALESLEGAVLKVRSDSYALLMAEEGTAGTLARATSIAVALLVPLGAVASYRVLQRRRQRQLQLELELKHQREQGRIKDEMIANLSHELRTPLTGIYGMALSMQETEFSDPEFLVEATGIIVHEAADLSRMVDDLLAAAKADAGELTFLLVETDVSRELEEVLVPFRSLDHTISVDCEPALLHIDRLRFRQLIRNLVSNAVKHGGSRIGIIGTTNGDRYRLAVVDDGPGVAQELERSMFDRFVHQGDEALTAGSVGLGLSIARLLARGMHGNLRYNRMNDLTTFIVDLPIAEASAPGRSDSTRSLSVRAS